MTIELYGSTKQYNTTKVKVFTNFEKHIVITTSFDNKTITLETSKGKYMLTRKFSDTSSEYIMFRNHGVPCCYFNVMKFEPSFQVYRGMINNHLVTFVCKARIGELTYK